jgi:hypothetical protein
MTTKPLDPQIAAQGGVSEAPTASSSELQRMPHGHVHLKQQQAPAAKQMPSLTALPQEFTEPWRVPNNTYPLNLPMPKRPEDTAIPKRYPELFGDKCKRL